VADQQLQEQQQHQHNALAMLQQEQDRAEANAAAEAAFQQSELDRITAAVVEGIEFIVIVVLNICRSQGTLCHH